MNRMRSYRGALAVLMLLCLGIASPSARAQPFELVSQSRTLDVAVNLTVFGADFARRDLVLPFSASRVEAGEWDDAITVPVRQSVVSLSSPDGQATADGRARVSGRSFIGTSAIRFSATPDVGTFGMATPPAQFMASATAAATLDAVFDIAATTVVEVSWLVGLGARGSSFAFELLRDGELVRQALDVSNGVADASLSFEALLSLDPGRYELRTRVDAAAASPTLPDPATPPDHALTFVDLQFAPVPEPGTAWLLLAGLGILAGGAARQPGRGWPADLA